MEPIAETDLRAAIANTPENHFVYWTGNPYRNQGGSLRSEALRLITEVRQPVMVRELMARAAHVDGGQGFNPPNVRYGLSLHQGAKPAVYLLLERASDGTFRAVRNIPHPDGFGRSFRPGEVVLPAEIGPTALGKVEAERARRWEMWSRLLEAGGPKKVEPGLLRELGIYGGAQGIWVDKARTEAAAAGSGVAVGILHTGSSYADDLADDGLIYHYPSTNRPAQRDAGEVEAVRAAGRLGLPLFVITYPRPKAPERNVQLGWVVGDDPEDRLFLIEFGERPPPPLEDEDDQPFELEDRTPRQRGATPGYVRPSQVRFQFEVLRRYGACCAVCDVTVEELLDAAHIRGKRERGSDDPRNGLILCATHHRAFDAELFGIEPETGSIHGRPRGPCLRSLQITKPSLQHLAKPPHQEALAWRWARWQG